MTETTLEKNRRISRTILGREICARCRRPGAACYCAHVRPIDTRTRLVLLQHPRERDVPIGTARMASLCLAQSQLLVGVDWTDSAPLARLLADPARRPILLYPGKGAIDIVADPPAGPVTLVVVDGTWAQAKKIVKTNPVLAALPRYAFVPPRPSEYRIRKEPDDASVATIEALVHALSALEQKSFDGMLEPFRAMIDFQIACETRFRAARTRHAKHRARQGRRRVPRVLDDLGGDVVCVAGEANAWPYTARLADPRYEDELVYWTAFRPSTEERFAFVVAPGRDLASGTPGHTGIPADILRSGGSLDELFAAWRAFARGTDVLCSWGHYETGLFLRAGGSLPERRVDVRVVAREFSHGGVGTLATFHERLCPEGRAPLALGRSGRKLAALADIVTALATAARA